LARIEKVTRLEKARIDKVTIGGAWQGLARLERLEKAKKGDTGTSGPCSTLKRVLSYSKN